MDKDQTNVAVGRLIRSERLKAGFSQGEVAQQVSEMLGGKYLHTTIGKIESGSRSTSLPEAVAIAKVLGFPLTEFMDIMGPIDIEGAREDVGRAVGACSAQIEESIMPTINRALEQLSSLKAAAEQIEEEKPKYRDRLIRESQESHEALEQVWDLLLKSAVQLTNIRDCYSDSYEHIDSYSERDFLPLPGFSEES